MKEYKDSTHIEVLNVILKYLATNPNITQNLSWISIDILLRKDKILIIPKKEEVFTIGRILKKFLKDGYVCTCNAGRNKEPLYRISVEGKLFDKRGGYSEEKKQNNMNAKGKKYELSLDLMCLAIIDDGKMKKLIEMGWLY
jgi:hypothetical protein